jgi:hypothetical protein
MDAPRAVPHTLDVAYERDIGHPDAESDAARVEEIRRRLADSQD